MKKHFGCLFPALLFLITINTSFGGYSHAFLWDPVTGIEDLGTLGEESTGTGVNDSGTVVGYYVTAGALTYRGFIWTASTGMIDIGLPGGEDGVTVSCRCTAINSAGHVVGYARQADGQQVAFFWTPETGFTTIGYHSSMGDNGNTAYAINDRDEVTGNLLVPHGRGNYHAYIWSPSQPKARDLGGIGDDPYGSTGAGINNRSEIVGDFGSAGGSGPMFWRRKTGVRLLGTIANAIYSQTTGVNDAGEIIGFYGTDTETLSFYTAPGLGLKVLSSLGGSATYALAINQSGIIAGEALDASGINYPVIWATPSASPEKIASNGAAFGINSLGQVVGTTYVE